MHRAEVERLGLEHGLGGERQLLECRAAVVTDMCVVGALLCPRPGCLQLALIKRGVGNMPHLLLELALRGLQHAVILVVVN